MNSTMLWLLHALIVVVGIGVGVWILEKFAFFKEGKTLVRWALNNRGCVRLDVFGESILADRVDRPSLGTSYRDPYWVGFTED